MNDASPRQYIPETEPVEDRRYVLTLKGYRALGLEPPEGYTLPFYPHEEDLKAASAR